MPDEFVQPSNGNLTIVDGPDGNPKSAIVKVPDNTANPERQITTTRIPSIHKSPTLRNSDDAPLTASTVDRNVQKSQSQVHTREWGKVARLYTESLPIFISGDLFSI